MWKCSGQSIQMVHGDFGVELPLTVTGAIFAAGDNLRLRITGSGEPVLERIFTDIQENTVALTLSAEESALLDVGCYSWTLDWYQGEVFLCNIVPGARFEVVAKA